MGEKFGLPPRDPALFHKINSKKFCSSLTYQSDKLAVQPAQDVWPLLRLSPVDGQSGHQDGRRLLVEGCSDALDLGLGVGPAAGEEAGFSMRSRQEEESVRLITTHSSIHFNQYLLQSISSTATITDLKLINSNLSLIIGDQ